MGRSHSHIKKHSTARRIADREEARMRRKRIQYRAHQRDAARERNKEIPV